MLTCHDITCIRGERELFKGLGFTLFPGSVLILRGANGCGKTSLLRVIAGLMKPAKGSISWNETNIQDEYDTYCSLMHYVGHKTALKPQLTVLENLEFWATLRGTPEALSAAIHYFGLAPVIDTPCYMLSAGWQRRVVLARMMSCLSRLWLLDEPTTNLDDDGVQRLVDAITVRCREGGAAVIASHVPLPFPFAIELKVEEYK